MAPARTFLGWDAPALPLAADVLLDRYTTRDDVAHLDETVVMLPGARAGRRLKEILVEKAGARGVRLVPPRVVTLGQVPELLYEPERPLARPAVARLAWAATLRDTPTEQLETVFAHLPATETLTEWGGLARELAAVHRRVARGGWRFRDVATHCRSAADHGEVRWDDAERWEVLAEVQRKYEDRLAGMDLADADLARIGALRAGGLEASDDLWLIGVSEIPGVIRQGLEAVTDRLHVLVHAPADHADAFDALGCVVPDAWKGAHVPIDESKLAICDRPDHQADEVARSLAELADGRAADEAVVGVPDPDVIPWIEERLTAAGVPVRSAAGKKIEASGPYRALAAVADYVDGRRFEALAALARHPDVAEWVAEGTDSDPSIGPALARRGSWLEPLDRWYGEHLQARVPDRLPGARKKYGIPVTELVEHIDHQLLDDLIGSPDTRPLSAWCSPALALLSRLYGDRPLTRERPADRALIRALQELADAVQAFKELPAILDEVCRAPSALRLFLAEASGATVPAEPNLAAVELLGWLELHLDDAPVTVVTGVNEPRLPESATADPFLPDALRARLGLLDNRLRYARDAYRLTAMIKSCEELRLVAGRRSATGDPVRPSRLLFACDGATAARRVRRFYDEEGESDDDGSVDPSDEPVRDEEQARKVSAFNLPPEPKIGPAEPPDSLRVTDFRGLLQDPYGYALKRFRNCEPLDDSAREMDALVFGNMAHRVLEEFGDSDAVHTDDPGAATHLLDNLLDEEVRRRFGPRAHTAHVAVRVQVEQLRARLRRFAEWHVAWVAGGWQVQGVECNTPEGGAPLTVDGMPIGIRARIDRVDYNAELDRWAVFDYKTGDKARDPVKAHRTNYGKDWCDLQLPLYRWLLPRVVDRATGAALFLGTEGADVQVGYLLLPRDLSEVGGKLADWSEADFADGLDTARAVVRRLRTDVFEFDPDVKPRFSDPRMEALLGRGQLTPIARGGGDTEDNPGGDA